jgi:hypothetical protein
MDVDEDDHELVAGEAAAAKAVEAAATGRPRTNQAAGSGGATAAGYASMDVDEKDDDEEEEVEEREGHTDNMLSMSPSFAAEMTLQLVYIAPVTPDDLALKEDEGTAAASTATKSSTPSSTVACATMITRGMKIEMPSGTWSPWYTFRPTVR